jgi:23S rRNA (cytosine1962-C5)-methyltransferase
MESTVVITARGEQRIRDGHLWIYRADVADAQASGGDTVVVRGPRARMVGRALYSDRSQIALRFLVQGDVPAGLDLWRSRLAAAMAYRASLEIDATAYRLVHGEGDLLPSLIVDRYGEYLVVQALSQGVDRLLPDLTSILVELVRPAGILARNDARVRKLEGLEPQVVALQGDVPPTVTVEESGVFCEADLWKGQKTGLFLDQRENRDAAAAYAHGRLLDCFSYNGGFALRLSRRCDSAVAVDASGDAVGRISRNAARNGITTIEAREANVFDELRDLERRGERFETIVLDPPAFAKNRAALPGAVAGYKEINLRALRLLPLGGVLVTCSCSYHVNEALFGQIVFEAAADARLYLQVLEKRMQGRDHPVVLGMPETYYLKCLILRRLA